MSIEEAKVSTDREEAWRKKVDHHTNQDQKGRREEKYRLLTQEMDQNAFSKPTPKSLWMELSPALRIQSPV